MSKPIGDSREAFERWAVIEGLAIPRDIDGSYGLRDTEKAWIGWQAAIAHKSEEVVPAGWKLIPWEPTDEMVEAAQKVWFAPNQCTDPTMHVWDAILAAAPAAPVAVPSQANVLRALRVARTGFDMWQNGHAFDTHGPAREYERVINETLIAIEDAAPVAVPVDASLTDWSRITDAATQANQQYGQFMPERWLQLFVAAFNEATK